MKIPKRQGVSSYCPKTAQLLKTFTNEAWERYRTAPVKSASLVPTLPAFCRLAQVNENTFEGWQRAKTADGHFVHSDLAAEMDHFRTTRDLIVRGLLLAGVPVRGYSLEWLAKTEAERALIPSPLTPHFHLKEN